MTQLEVFHVAVTPESPKGCGAVLSEDETRRFLLWRVWMPDRPRLLFIGYNPSTADARHDDPTVRRFTGFADREGAGGFEVVNLFSERTPYPWAVRGIEEPPATERYVRAALRRCSRVVACWGAPSSRRNIEREREEVRRVRRVVELAREEHRELLCLGRTMSGWPRHPLYLRSDTPLEPWQQRRESERPARNAEGRR